MRPDVGYLADPSLKGAHYTVGSVALAWQKLAPIQGPEDFRWASLLRQGSPQAIATFNLTI